MLLERRDRTSPLHECEIRPYPRRQPDEAHRYVESWVQYAVSCRVSVLRVLNWPPYYPHLELSNSSVICKDLKRLELFNLEFDESPLDLLSCEALEVLVICACSINLGDILPKSLHRLIVRDSRLHSMQAPRGCLSAPGLLTFELADCEEWTPLLESLPSLVTSFIMISKDSEDACTHNEYLGDCGDDSCEGCYGKDDRCLLLEGLAGATNLELISEYSVIFRKDLRWSPVFSKLKTLLLNGWCLTANFAGLLYFLQHTSILEKLTLLLSCPEDLNIVLSGSYKPARYFLVSKHLKVVEIHCREEDEWINKIVNILGIHGVTSAQISIKYDSWCSSMFSFQQTE